MDGEVEYTWRDFRTRARRFASALQAGGLEKGDRIAFLALNSEPLLLAHFGVPLAGGTLVSVNTRLSPDEIGYIIEQSGSTKVFYSPELRDQIPNSLSGVELLSTEEELEDLLSQGRCSSSLIILGMARKTGSHLWIFQGLLIRKPIRNTTR